MKNIKSIKLFFVFFFLLLQFETALAEQQKFLPANKVFVPSISSQSTSNADISIDIQKGYYVYQNRQLTVSSEDVDIKSISLSKGETKHDQFFGDQLVWFGDQLKENPAIIHLTYQNPNQLKKATLHLKLQGCLDKVICYPPEDYSLSVNLLDSSGDNATLDFLGNKTKNQSVIVERKEDPFLLNSQADSSLLPADQAFQIYVKQVNSTNILVSWEVSKGYYLYQSKIALTDLNQSVSQVIYSQGEDHEDQFFGKQTVYRYQQNAVANFYFKNPVSNQLTISYQGCADIGICYPVIHKVISLENGNVTILDGDANSLTKTPTKTEAKISAEQSSIKHLDNTLENKLLELFKSHLWLGLLFVLLLGIPLFFTPCMLPVAPILLGIISGGVACSVKRSLFLSFLYVLGMAVVMAIFGLIFSFTGINLQFVLQKPWLLIVFAGFFVIMGLGMLGRLTINLPSSLQSKVYGYQSKFKARNPVNIFIIGGLSSLVVGSCATPLLFALLAVISTLNSPIIGGLSLFMLGFGMGLPLIVFSVFSSKIPKTGPLSVLITKIFAMMMFGVALWLLSRLIPAQINLFIFAIYLIIFSWVLLSEKLKGIGQKIIYVIVFLFLLMSAAWIYGGVLGHTNLLKPLAKNSELVFIPVHNMSEIQTEIQKSHRPVMLDLYADWCVSCKELEFLVFTDQTIDEKLSNFTLLRLDLTNTTKEHHEILAHYELVGPPVLLFFDPKKAANQPINRIVGVPEIKDFSQLLDQVKEKVQQ